MEILLARECSAIGVTLKQSDILYPGVRRGSFVAQSVGNGIIAGYFHRCHVYENLSSGGPRFNTCAGCVLKVTTETFLKLASQIPGKPTDRDMVRHSAWLFQLLFVMLQMND